ncbi:MAG: PAS domain S-box protein [Gemmatimonadaceae bacterium]
MTKTRDLVVNLLGTYSDALNQKRLVLATNPAGKVLQFGPGQRSAKWPFADAFEHAPNGMALVDGEGRIVQANIGFCEILGFGRPELLGLGLSEITHPDDAESEAERRTRLAVGEIDRYQLAQRLIREDGEATWVLLSVSACRGISGSPEYYVVQIESAGGHLPVNNGAAPDAVAYRVGEALHEIGNALTPLMVSTQLIVEQSGSEEIRDSAHVIFNAARRIAFTIKRLHDIESSRAMALLGKGRMLDLRMGPPPEKD